MTKLRVGDRAPEFTATTQDGATIHLSDFVGNRSVVLYFYPRDASPVCTKEACSFRDSYEQFQELGAEIIGVSGDSEESHRTFAEQQRLPFRLISDADGTIRKAFGVTATLGLFPKRVTFVIDKEGIIRLIFSALFASHEHVQQSREALEHRSSSGQQTGAN